MSKQRIDKILSHEGFGSRKDIKKLLRNCEVLLNGKRVIDAGTLLDDQSDILSIDGEEINLHRNTFLMMNKIMHTVSSNKDGEHQTVFDLLEEKYHTPYLQEHLHLVGRLDMDTEGLLLFTTDGALTHRLISPKSHVDKTYFCILEHKESDDHKKEIEKQFELGIEVGPEDNDEGFKCESAAVTWPDSDIVQKYLGNSSYFTDVPQGKENSIPQAAILTIHEGKYHQVKRMFQAVGNKIIFLKRISMGTLNLDLTLPAGQYRELSEQEIENLSQ